MLLWCCVSLLVQCWLLPTTTSRDLYGLSPRVSSFLSSTQPIPLMNIEIEIAPSGGRIHEGVTEIPFELRLASDTLYPTYHGVFINVSYILSVDCDRGVIKKSLTHSQELLVETAPVSKIFSSTTIDETQHTCLLAYINHCRHWPVLQVLGSLR